MQYRIVFSLPMQHQIDRVPFTPGDDLSQHGAQDTLLELGRSFGIVPELRQILGQGQEFLFCVWPQQTGLFTSQVFRFFLHLLLCPQSVIPASL
jgi:hypothetical protein